MAAMDDPSADISSSTFIPSLYKPPSLLPVARHRDALLYTIEKYPVTIVVGQTGSGKTTQIPQFLHQAGWTEKGGIVGVTQPRRVAATTVATRVAEEMRCSLGQEVGYSIRFEDATSEATRIKFLTDGMSLREALVDPLLQRYSVIMVDEAHERSLSSDVLLGLLKKIRKRRKDLRIVISSATLQAEEFLRFFAGEEKESEVGRIVSLEGRMFPVDVHYLEEPAEDYVEKAVQTALDIHTQEPDGDILIFLTGREEIDTAIQLLSEYAASLPHSAQTLQALPLYAGLSIDQQMYVFEPAAQNTRKCIVATNIAEASVTIDGILYVIDCGYVKLRAYNPSTGIDSLTACPVSQASATQRAGRAGRTRPGKCYRLYTEASFHDNLPPATVPEIQRSNLAPLVLQLKALGIDNIVRFDFLTPPPAELLIRAMELLYSLGVLDDYAKLTRPLGVRMAEMAIEPMMGKALLSSPELGCLPEMLTVAAMASVQEGLWVYDGEGGGGKEGKREMEMAKRVFLADEGDQLTKLNVYKGFCERGKKGAKWCREHRLNFKALSRAVSVRNQLWRQMERFGIVEGGSSALSGGSGGGYGGGGGAVLRAGGLPLEERICRCLTMGFFAHAARMVGDGSFRTVDGGMTLFAHPGSVMFNRKADWVIFHEAMHTRDKTYIRDVTKVEKKWLLEYGEGYYNSVGK